MAIRWMGVMPVRWKTGLWKWTLLCKAAKFALTSAARTFIARVKTEYADAQHNVPAYIIGSGNTVTEFCSDDGEPSGTAGKPALAVLRGSGLGDVAVVITRYFGGTLLGTGGLVKAYTESTQMVVNAVPRGRRIPVHIVMFVIPYPLLERMRAVAALQHADIMGEDFGADITMTVRIPVESFEAFQTELGERSAGKSKEWLILPALDPSSSGVTFDRLLRR